MRTTIVAVALLLISAAPGRSDTCAEKFTRVLTGYENKMPVKSHIVSEMKGQPPSENDFLSVSWQHYMTKTTKGPWYLTYDGTMFQSSDEGKSWTKVRSFDKDKTRAAGMATVKAQAGTVRNAVCGEEALDGVAHDTMEADTTNLTPQKFEIHTKYWVNRKTGFVSKTITRMTAPTYEIHTTQISSPADGLTLPVPE